MEKLWFNASGDETGEKKKKRKCERRKSDVKIIQREKREKALM